MLLSIDGAPYRFRCLPYLAYRDDLLLDLLIPEAPGPRPAVIYVHGGGWEHGDRAHGMYPWMNPVLAAHGFVTASITYRLTDVWPFPTQILDAKAAVRWLRVHASEYGIDPDRIGAWGDSAGGHLVALLGTSAGVAELEESDVSSAVQAVVARCAPTHFRLDAPWSDVDPDVERVVTRLFAAPDPERWMRLASPATQVGPDSPPVLLVHGTADGIVPFSQAGEMVTAMRAHGRDVTLHAIDGGGHSLLTPAEEASADRRVERYTALTYEALAFFTKHLGAGLG